MDLTRTARIGALCWIVATPLFLAANVVVGLRWSRPAFSWAEHNISDLGNVTCGRSPVRLLALARRDERDRAAHRPAAGRRHAAHLARRRFRPERVAVLPLLLWTCAAGIALLRPAHRASRSTAEYGARQYS